MVFWQQYSIWTFFIADAPWHTNIALFFLSCIAIAGVYGGATVDKKVIAVQTTPAAISIFLSYRI